VESIGLIREVSLWQQIGGLYPWKASCRTEHADVRQDRNPVLHRTGRAAEHSTIPACVS